MSDDVLVRVEGVGKKFCKSLKRSLRLDVPVSFSGIDVNVLLVIETSNHSENKYDCSGLLVKLKWNRDAVKAQRELHDEWKE